MTTITIYTGAVGTGKTLAMVKDGLGYYLDGWKIIRNFDAKFGEYMDNEDILALNKDSDLNHCVLLIDEIQVLFDSRNSATTNNKLFSNFMQQIRKRDIIILATTQYANAVEKRFKQFITVNAFPIMIETISYTVCKVTYMDITRLQSNDILQPTFKPTFCELIFDAKQIYPLYNTKELIGV